MSTVTHIPTTSLRVHDTLLVDSSMVGVSAIKPDDLDDGIWLRIACLDGNFDQWDGWHYAQASDQWAVLNADRGDAAEEPA